MARNCSSLSGIIASSRVRAPEPPLHLFACVDLSLGRMEPHTRPLRRYPQMRVEARLCTESLILKLWRARLRSRLRVTVSWALSCVRGLSAGMLHAKLLAASEKSRVDLRTVTPRRLPPASACTTNHTTAGYNGRR